MTALYGRIAWELARHADFALVGSITGENVQAAVKLSNGAVALGHGHTTSSAQQDLAATLDRSLGAKVAEVTAAGWRAPTPPPERMDGVSKQPWQDDGRRNQYEANPHAPGTLNAAAWDLSHAASELFDGMVRVLRIDRLLHALSRLGHR